MRRLLVATKISLRNHKSPKEREHRRDEEQRDRNGRVEVEERAQEKHGDDRADQQCRRGA